VQGSQWVQRCQQQYCLHWEAHSWDVKLDAGDFKDSDICDKVQLLIRSNRKQIDSRFPKKDTDLVGLFRDFHITQIQHFKPSQMDKYGHTELVALMDMLSTEDNGVNQFHCQAPFVGFSNQSIRDAKTMEICA
jgi:hypothetical protein